MKTITISNHLKNPLLFIAIALTICLIGYIYFDGLSVLILQWLRLDEFWRFVIIPVSLFFIWNKRKEFGTTKIRPSILSGIALIIPGCITYVLWKIVFVDFFIEIGLFLLTLGLISLFLGTRFNRLFLLPLGYLVLMTSIIERILSPITVFMQYASAFATSLFMNTFGWGVLLDGRLLRLPGTVLEVASECSGTGQLTALIAFTIPLGVVMHRSMLPKILLLCMTIPLALLVNTIRIILISLWNYDRLKEAIHGPYEILRMPFIYPLALILLYLFSLFLSRLEKKKNYISQPVTPKEMTQTGGREKLVSAIYIGLSLLVFMIACMRLLRVEPANYVHHLNELPDAITGWQGENVADSCVSFYFGKPDETLARKYRNNNGSTLLLYIARFNVQHTRKRISSLESGLFAKDERRIVLGTDPDININTKFTSSENNRSIRTVSWFDIDGKTYSNISDVRKKNLVNSVQKKRNNAALVAISSDIGDGKSNEGDLRLFIAAIYPFVKKILETSDRG
jgi:EpsI family protein